MDEIEKLLEELSNAPGPSGYEGPVREIVRREMSPVVDHIELDGVGSLIARKDGPEGSPRVMMAAHMDEVGLLVKYVTDEGFVKFHTLGGWLDQALITQRWVIMTRGGPVQAVTGMKTPHVMSPDERTAGFKRTGIFLDVGATNKYDALNRLGIQPGDPIAPDSKFTRLNGGDFLLGKAWDDRIGIAIMIQVMKALDQDPPPCTLYAVATVQEEIGLRGAHTSSYKVNPDIGINLEAGVAADYPGITADEAQELLGHGPGLFLHDSTMLPNLKLRDLIVDLAKDIDIPLQFEILAGYGEDGSEMQRTHSGAPAINISVPVRYLHNHNGVVHRRDFDQTVTLVTALVKRLDASTVEQLKSFD